MARGCFASLLNTSVLLIGLFVDLLRKKVFVMRSSLHTVTFLNNATSVLSGQDIDHSHAATLVLDRYRRLQDKILGLDIFR